MEANLIDGDQSPRHLFISIKTFIKVKELHKSALIAA